MNKSFWIILAVAVVGLAGVFFLSGGKAKNDDAGQFAYNADLLSLQSHDQSQGSGNKATVIEYADFQCVYCGAYYPVMKELKATYGDDVKVIFRNFPIPTSHPQSLAAHRAAGAAANQGKFWEMHDKLFENQTSWSGQSNASQIFETYAQELGLNMDQFKTDVQSEAVAEKINSDLDSGKQLKVSGTPTLFVNGTMIPANQMPKNMEEWDKLINPQPAQ